ncbi:MAG: AtpZ/AtpI family protein [Saprospiraceae bacterium]|nr:AtpZ/AtpI family protein [Saprospiraceae bacterium]MBK7812320.1 AtpZ/AtpI family protein [Saprospiraceae bacterium]MBK9632455.1 AtpZ/AtpI family protein [Saprospiraceae bacterium]
MKKKGSSGNSYLKYSGMAFQIFVLLGTAAWFGQFLDRRFLTEKPYWTITAVAISFIMIIIWLYYNLKKEVE